MRSTTRRVPVKCWFARVCNLEEHLKRFVDSIFRPLFFFARVVAGSPFLPCTHARTDTPQRGPPKTPPLQNMSSKLARDSAVQQNRSGKAMSLHSVNDAKLLKKVRQYHIHICPWYLRGDHGAEQG